MREQRAGLLTLATGYFTLGTASLAVVGLLDPMARDLSAHTADVARLVTVFALTYAFAAPLSQVVFGAWSRRRLLLLGLALLAAGCLSAALATSLDGAIVARVVIGLGAAIVGPMSSALGAGMVEPDEQARALAVVFGGLILSTVMGVPLATWAGQVLSWRGVFAALALLALVCIPAAMRLVQERRAAVAIRPGAMVDVLANAPTSWSLFGTLLQSAGQFASYTLVAALLTEGYALDAAHVSLALLLFGLGGIVGNALGGSLGDRLRPMTLIWTSVLGMTVVFVLMTLAQRQVVAGLALFAAWAVLAMVFQAPQQKRLLGLAPRFGGLVLAMNSSALHLGMSLGSWAGAFAYRTWGVKAMPVTSAVLMGVAALAMLLSQQAAASSAVRSP